MKRKEGVLTDRSAARRRGRKWLDAIERSQSTTDAQVGRCSVDEADGQLAGPGQHDKGCVALTVGEGHAAQANLHCLAGHGHGGALSPVSARANASPVRE